MKFWDQWGYVCSDGFDANTATVACRSMGYSGGVAYRHTSSRGFLQQDMPMWLSNLSCTGNEQDLNSCSHSGWANVGNCSTDTVAGVLCYQEQGKVNISVHVRVYVCAQVYIYQFVKTNFYLFIFMLFKLLHMDCIITFMV